MYDKEVKQYAKQVSKRVKMASGVIRDKWLSLRVCSATAGRAIESTRRYDLLKRRF